VFAQEVDIGLAADVGTLQRLPKVVGNDSLARELVYSARRFQSDEALQFGMVSRVFPDREACVNGAIDMAELIASKSPVGVQGSKVNMVYSRDHSVQEGLDFIVRTFCGCDVQVLNAFLLQAVWNQGMLQSEDVMKAAMASMQKTKPTFSKL
jgi:delta(3,5)-delta(2,4)-dienoyl-CoA isomerase